MAETDIQTEPSNQFPEEIKVAVAFFRRCTPLQRRIIVGLRRSGHHQLAYRLMGFLVSYYAPR